MALDRLRAVTNANITGILANPNLDDGDPEKGKESSKSVVLQQIEEDYRINSMRIMGQEPPKSETEPEPEFIAYDPENPFFAAINVPEVPEGYIYQEEGDVDQIEDPWKDLDIDQGG